MRLLLINYEYPPIGAGAATATREIGAAIRRLGHDVTVVSAAFEQHSGVMYEEGVRLIRLPSARRRPESATIREMLSFVVHSCFKIRRLVLAEKFDGIVAFFSIPGGPAAYLGWKTAKVPYIVSLRGGDVPGAEKGIEYIHVLLAPLRRHILSKAKAIVANSDGLRDLAENADHFPVSTVPNGVDSMFFVPRARASAKQQVGLLFVGRFQAQKNLLWLLDVLSEVRRLPGRPFNLKLVGDGPLRGELKERAEQLGISDLVTFWGWKDRNTLRTIYQDADLIINPSLYEGMPNVVLEAMSCGCPALVSRVPGNESVVTHGETGWLFDLNSAEGCAQLLHQIINDPDSRSAAGLKSRERAQTEYSWSAAGQRYLELLGLVAPASTA